MKKAKAHPVKCEVILQAKLFHRARLRIRMKKGIGYRVQGAGYKSV